MVMKKGRDREGAPAQESDHCCYWCEEEFDRFWICSHLRLGKKKSPSRLQYPLNSWEPVEHQAAATFQPALTAPKLQRDFCREVLDGITARWAPSSHQQGEMETELEQLKPEPYFGGNTFWNGNTWVIPSLIPGNSPAPTHPRQKLRV